MSLELVIDPVDCHFPLVVRELLNQVPDPANRQTSTSLTPDGYAYFLHEKAVYLWNCFEDDRDRPPYCLTLPATDSKVTTSMIALVHGTDNPLPSVMAVNPEGMLRYWDNLSDPDEYVEKSVGIVNDVVHSVLPFGNKDRIYFYLLSTATGSFYIIDVFKGRYPKIGNKPSITITKRQITFSRSTLSKWLTDVPSGSVETSKQGLIKTLVADRLVHDVDVVAVFKSTIEFYSTRRNVVTDKVDLTDYILQDIFEAEVSFNSPESFAKINEAWNNVSSNRSIYIVDAISSDGGLLLLVAAEKPDQRNLTFALVFLTAKSVTAKKSSWAYIVDLPQQYCVGKTTQFHASLYTPTPWNFVIVFPTMVVYLEYIDGTNTISRICYYSTFTDELIGTACVGTYVQIIMKRRGICNVRHLPRGFDTRFWLKYGSRFDAVSKNPTNATEAIAYIFTLFAMKSLPEARFAYTDLAKAFPDKSMLVEIIVSMTKNMLNGKPSIDPRWNQNPPDSPARVKFSSAMSVMTHVNDKLSFYKMIVMFVRYFGYIESFSTPMSIFAGRSPLAVMTELGEMVFAMKAVINMTHEMFCPNVESAINDLGADIQRSLSMTNNNSLKAKDYFAKEVTSFPALIPAVLKKQEHEIEEKDVHAGNDVWEVSQMFVAIAQSMNAYRGEEWTIKPDPREQVLTNNPEFLAQFLFQFNMVFDVLDNRRCTAVESLLNSAITIGRFLLSKQSPRQINRSPIIQRFYDYGNIKVALQLAQDYGDFATLLQLCYQEMPAIQRRHQLAKYQAYFNCEEFDDCLREYQREHGQRTELPERHADRAESFLVKHPELKWIQNVEKKEYDKAKIALKTNADSTPNAQNKKTVLALAKLAALCEDKVDDKEVNQLTNDIALLEHQEKINPDVLKSVNPTNAPMSLDAIVNANLSGGDKENFLRALLALTTIIDTAETDKLDTLRTRIWSTIIKADTWEKVIKMSSITLAEEFEARLNTFFDESMLAQVLQQLYIYDLPNNLKMQLLPQSTAPLKKLYQFNEDWAQTYFGEVLDTAFGETRRHLNKKDENSTA
uniref:Nucleoporin_C domain-containing protein n=1 Tax=Panagrellus redivivus TaxID=6233 RepID=A0A7E4UQ45_PANRE